MPQTIRETIDHWWSTYYRGIAALVLLLIMTLITIALWPARTSRLPVAILIGLAAAAGSMANEPSRNNLSKITGFVALVGYMAWKLAVAIVLAFVLYLMVASGIVGGDAFPTLVAGDAAFENVLEFAKNLQPALNKDVAKVLVWSFVAGYSERFVPNLIARVVEDSKADPPAQE